MRLDRMADDLPLKFPPVLLFTSKSCVVHSKDHIRNPKKWLIAAIDMFKPNIPVKPRALQRNNMLNIFLVLGFLPTLEGNARNLHFRYLVVESLQAFAPIPFRFATFLAERRNNYMVTTKSRN
ncbi:hypothetical protein SAMN05660745_00438 [Corynebacterium glucuronolyticum]|nr:hypothetical protein CGLUCO_01410 [Corynebacterium glucuronolyticum DSM 44120]SMB77886.1 hypothetical protein SAMN05660745_00438 [Corynebacterium glucuronolyticum]